MRGAPVFGQDGNVMGAISVSSLYKPTEDYDALGCLVRAKGRDIKAAGLFGKMLKEAMEKLIFLHLLLLTNEAVTIKI